MASYREHGFGLWATVERESGTPLGMCGLLKRDTLEHVDLGFAFLERHWGVGYALEAATGVLEHARDELGIERLLAVTAENNERSMRLLEKLGMRQEGMVRLAEEEPECRLFGLDLC